MEDFSLKSGELRNGIRAASLVGVLLVAIPILLILIITLSTQVGPSASNSIENLAAYAIIFGILSTVLAFLFGFYRKGTISRLAFGLALSVMSLVYAFEMLMTEVPAPLLSDLGFSLDVNRLFLLSIYAPAILAFIAIGQFFAYRNTWSKSIGKEITQKTLDLKSRIVDFSPRIGLFDEGTKAARRSCLLFVVLTFIVVLIGSAVIHSSNLSAWSALESYLVQTADLILLLGIIVVPISFIRGYYPKGSIARMVAGLTFAAIVALYIFLIVGDSRLQNAISAAGLELDVPRIAIILILTSVFVALGALGELIDERKAWKRSIGYDVKIRSFGPKTWSLDFDPRIGKMGNGAKKAQSAYLNFLVAPTIILVIAAGVAHELSLPDLTSLDTAFASLFDVILLFGLILVILNFVRGFYPSGTFGRMTFGLITIPVLLVYATEAFTGMGLESALRSNGVYISLSDVLSILLIYIIYVVVIEISEFIDYRREWKRSVGRPLKAWKIEEEYGGSQDFRARYAKFAIGAPTGKRGLSRYIVIPALLVVIIKATMISAAINFIPNDGNLMQLLSQEIIGTANSLQMLSQNVLLLGLLLAALMYFKGAYWRGSLSRLVFAWGVAIVSALWVYSFFSGFGIGSSSLIPGLGSLGMGLPGLSIGNDLSAPLGYIMFFLVIFALLTGVMAVFEFRAHRKEFHENRQMQIDREKAFAQSGSLITPKAIEGPSIGQKPSNDSQ